MNSFVNEGVGRRNMPEPKVWIVPSALLDLGNLCLWVALGVTLTGLAFALGFGAEVTQALGTG
jgi:hypothetical protein